MNAIIEVYNWLMANKETLLNLAAYLIAIGSIIVKLIPTLDKNNRWLPFVKWVGKYIALDKGKIPDEERNA
jgi:hypothetical protein